MTIKKINISAVEGDNTSVFPAGTVYFNESNELRRADGFTAGGILIRSTATDNLLVLGNTATYVEVTTSTTVVIHTTDPVAVISRSAENADMGGGNAMMTSIASSPTITDVKSGWVVTGAGIVGITTVTNAVINGGWYIISLDDSNGSTFIGHNGTGTYQTYTFTTPELYNWVFANDGTLTFPQGGVIDHPSLESINIRTNSNNNGYVQLQNDDAEFGSSFVYLENGRVSIETGGGFAGSVWTFGNESSLTFPDNTVQTTAWTGTVAYSNITDVPLISTSTSTLVNGTSTVSLSSTGALTLPDGGILRMSTAPTSSEGAVGDKAGTVAVNSSSIFYCIADYFLDTGTYSVVTTNSNDGSVFFIEVAKASYPQPQIGWGISISGNITQIDGAVTDLGTSWKMSVSAVTAYSPGTNVTLTNPSPSQANIWVKQAWGTTGSW